MNWRAEIHYKDGSCAAPFQFADFDDFQDWLLKGGDHDWSVVSVINIIPELDILGKQEPSGKDFEEVLY